MFKVRKKVMPQQLILFKFELPEDSHVSLSVFVVLGRKVAEIANGNYAAGQRGMPPVLRAACTLHVAPQRM